MPPYGGADATSYDANASLWRCRCKFLSCGANALLRRCRWKFLSCDANAHIQPMMQMPPHGDADAISYHVMQMLLGGCANATFYIMMQMFFTRCKYNLTKKISFVSKSRLLEASNQIFWNSIYFFQRLSILFQWGLNAQCNILAPKQHVLFWLKTLESWWTLIGTSPNGTST